MQRNIFIAAMAAAIVGASAIAATANSRGPDFSTLDSNGDGEVTLSELQARGQVRFDATDTDGDGLLSRAELEARGTERAKERAARMISRMDADEDGALSREELRDTRRTPARFFNRMDSDDSGGISEAEFDEARARFEERRLKRHGGN